MAIRFIKLRCQSCLSTTCPRKPIGSWCTETEGCTKEVTELEGNMFYHYAIELKPELRRQAIHGHWNEELWTEYEQFMQTIYDKPKGERFKY